MNQKSFKNKIVTRRQHRPNGVKLEINPLTLSFRDDQAGLEKLFLSNYFTTNLRHSRLCHIFTIVLYGLSGILELVLFPDSKAAVWTIRYGIVIPIFMIGLPFSYSSYYAKIWQLIQAFYILATGSSFTMMIIVGPKPTVFSYYVGVIICMIFGYRACASMPLVMLSTIRL